MKFKNTLFVLILSALSIWVGAAPNYWQQRVTYHMDIQMDVKNHRFTGVQELWYTNNSPDTITDVYYHLYFNAFQPNSAMDVRQRSLPDPDKRIGRRIKALNKNQIGYHKIDALFQGEEELKYQVEGTILEAALAAPLLPGDSCLLKMEFNSQVPLQIRRSGRQNNEGVMYSMSQWYPKLCEYDERGWHANPYIGREYYGVWGSFFVNITIDSSYVLGGTGILKNACEIGHGYCNDEVKRPEKDELTWKFEAHRVHDFVWAADPDYKHTKIQVPDGPVLHFLYQDKDTLTEAWERLPSLAVEGMQYFSNRYGDYPFPQYSIIQGGDGGMEYPMATLITGRRRLPSLIGVTLHEMAHSWYQMLLGTNESLYPWMDEGFTNFVSNEAFWEIRAPKADVNPHQGAYQSYFALVNEGLEEPMTTHADHYNTNFTYGVNAYSKGELFLVQLRGIIGQEAFDRALLRYFREWAFRHPAPIDFLRIAEKESGLELDWYLEYWIYGTKHIEYGIEEVKGKLFKTEVVIKRNLRMPMPQEILVEFKDGSNQRYYIPLAIMRGERPNLNREEVEILADWSWTHQEYSFTIPKGKGAIKKIELISAGYQADLDEDNNSWGKEEDN